jgi:hypothetical protein
MVCHFGLPSNAGRLSDPHRDRGVDAVPECALDKTGIRPGETRIRRTRHGRAAPFGERFEWGDFEHGFVSILALMRTFGYASGQSRCQSDDWYADPGGEPDDAPFRPADAGQVMESRRTAFPAVQTGIGPRSR